jgi:hypothetical protein
MGERDYVVQPADVRRVQRLRLYQAPPPSSHSSLLDLQRAIGNQRVALALQRGVSFPGFGHVLQRQDDEESGSESAEALSGAPPVIEAGQGSQEPESTDETVQRQDDGGSPAAGGISFACQDVSWADYPVGDPGSGFHARTGWQWTLQNNTFTVRFNPSTSVVRARWKNDTGPESMELLRHERYHLRLACLIVAKANAAVATGIPVKTVRKQLVTTLDAQTRSYDIDTQHGTVRRMQDMWVSDIDAGIPQFPFQ